MRLADPVIRRMKTMRPRNQADENAFSQPSQVRAGKLERK
jgi:hypothetical protein